MTEEVQVWVASLAVSDDRYAQLAASVPQDESNHAASLHPVAARRYVVARGILRNLLSGFTGTDARKLRFIYGASGKPSLSRG